MSLTNTIYRALDLSGIIALFRRSHFRDVAILMFHGVVDENVDSSWTPLRPQLSVTKFEWILRSLAPHYEFVSMDTAIDLMSGDKHGGQPKIAVTFDDGYDNNIRVALPVLERLEVPAIIYLATSFVEKSQPLWVDRLDYAIQQLPERQTEVEYKGRVFSLGAGSRHRQRVEFSELRRVLKRDSLEEAGAVVIENFVRQVERKADRSLTDCDALDTYSSFMPVSTVREVCDHPLVSFGCHTRNHPILPGLSKEVKQTEIVSAKREIEEWSQHECRHFAYPNGDYDNETVDVVRDSGFVSAVTTETGLNGTGCDMLRLSRFHVPLDQTQSKLLAQIATLDRLMIRLKSYSSSGLI